MRLANAHNPRKHTQPSSSVSPLSSTTTLPSPAATASTAASPSSTSTTTTIDPLWQLQHIHVEFYTALAALSAATSMVVMTPPPAVAAAASSKKQQKKKRNKRRSDEDDSPQSSSTVSLEENRPHDHHHDQDQQEEENERVRLRRSFYSLSSHYGRHALRRCREARHGFHVPVPRLAAGGGGAAALRSSRGVLSTSIAHRYLCSQCGCFCRQTVDHRLLRPFASLDGSLKKQKKRTKTKSSPLSAVPQDVTEEIFTTTATTTDEKLKNGEDDDDGASSRLTWTIRRAALHCPRCCHCPEEAGRTPGGNQELTVAPLPSTSSSPSLRLAKPCRRKRCRSSSSSSMSPSAHRPSHVRLGPTTATSIKTTHVVNLRTRSSSEPKPASPSFVSTANLGAEASQSHHTPPPPPPASRDKGLSKNTPKSSSSPPAVTTTAAIRRNEVPVPAAAASRPSSAAVKKTNHPPPPPPTAPASSKRKVPPSSSFMNSLSNLGL